MPQPPFTVSWLAEGFSAIREGNARKARRLLRGVLADDPGSGTALLGMAVLAFEDGDLPAAFDVLHRAYRLNAADGDVRQNMMAILNRIQNAFVASVGNALSAFSEESLQGLLGVLGTVQRCVRYFDVRGELCGRSIAVAYFTALFLLRLKKITGAEARFLEALELCRIQNAQAFRDCQVNVANNLIEHGRAEFVVRNCVFDLHTDIVLRDGALSTAPPAPELPPAAPAPVTAAPAAVVECFMFYNEADILEIKLAEHYPHIDRFVIVEGNRSFSGEPRALVFPQCAGRFAAYADKISYLPIDLPAFDVPSAAEAALRNTQMRGLTTLAPSDFVIVSDTDEIIRGSVLAQLRRDLANPVLEIAAFRMPVYWHRLNYLCVHAPDQRAIDGVPQPLITVGARYGFLKNNPPMVLRHKRSLLRVLDGGDFQKSIDNVRIYGNAGWHFSFLGEKDDLLVKMKNYGHQELYQKETLEALDLTDIIRSRRNFLDGAASEAFRGWQWDLVEIDGTFPALVQRERDRFASFIVQP